MALGRKIVGRSGSFEIMKPEFIDGYDADHVVIRYFDRSMGLWPFSGTTSWKPC